ncbi:MAG: hypothetical protein HWE23_16755 [Rhodobacteraceae bacterium]|nr:hypothetical protein [Paracoccaceae bacterium]
MAWFDLDWRGFLNTLLQSADQAYTRINSFLLQNPLVQTVLDFELLWVVGIGLVAALYALIQWILERIHLARIRKAAGNKIVVLVARFHNDKRDRLQKHLNLALCQNLIQHDSVAVESFLLPKRFATDLSGPKLEDAQNKAKQWLKRVNGDILVWGDNLGGNTTNSANLFFVGRNRTRKTFKVAALDVSGGNEDLSKAFLALIDHELTAVRDIVYQTPERARTDLVERLLAKYEALAAHTSAALPEDWRKARAEDARRMRHEVMRRRPVVVEETSAPEPLFTEADLAALDPTHPDEALLWAQTALALVKIDRRKAFYEVDEAALENALGRLETARRIFSDHAAREDEAECLFEKAMCLTALRDKLAYPPEKFDAAVNQAQTAVEDFNGHAVTLTKQLMGEQSSGDGNALALKRGLAAKALLLHVSNHNGKAGWLDLFSSLGSPIETPDSVLDRLPDLQATLDLEAQALLVLRVCTVIFSEADLKGDLTMKRKSLASVDRASRADRPSPLKLVLDTNNFRFANQLATAAGNLEDPDATLYFDRAWALVEKLLPALERTYGRHGLRFDLRLAENFSDLVSIAARKAPDQQLADTYIAKLISAIDRAEEVYPFNASYLLSSTIVALNNLATHTDRLDYAEQAYNLARYHREAWPDDLHALYILAYAADQRARLIDPTDSSLKDQAAMEAGELWQDVHRSAVEQDHTYYAHVSVRSKHYLKDRFPSLFSQEDPDALPNGTGTIDPVESSAADYTWRTGGYGGLGGYEISAPLKPSEAADLDERAD